MSKWDRLLARILGSRSDANINFDELCTLLVMLGYTKKTSGSHRIFRQAGQREIINIQPRKDGKAKPYQVGQVRAIFRMYGITKMP